MKMKEKVYELVSEIPAGKVTTYSELARAIGKPKASRAIGQILNKNPNPIIVPCHRVVRSNGDLGGYAYGSRRKLNLLAKEGVKVLKGKVLDFDKVKFRF
jgi:methylated-DNA-[protein]-cysteine S-methyltransferase